LASLVPCLLGFATAHYDGISIQIGLALATVIGALAIHAGVNVLNDYYDALNGTDAQNTERLYPFTGGSRFIQNEVLTTRQTACYGTVLLATGAAIGAALAIVAGPDLWLIGVLGLILGWAYSAPPLSLNSHGLGELSVAIGFGLLIPLGVDYVQRGVLAQLPLWAGMPYALLVANLLYINQFPDRRADEAAGKRHWVVRLGSARARWGYALIALAAYAMLLFSIVQHKLPAIAGWALIPAALSFIAAYQLIRRAQAPKTLRPAIGLTIAAMLTYGLILAGVLVMV
jgi:1,4-dihydroxy-2-naphthoate octaprenyltransferase